MISRLWNFSLRALTNRECGALEAADTLIGLQLYGTDRNTTIKWININEIRSKKLKRLDELQKLDKDSSDIFCSNMVDDYYPHRPEELEHCSLYNFMRRFDYTTIKLKDATILCYKMKGGYIKERKHPCLINHYKYNINIDPEKYFHALLLLFKPWRNFADLKSGYDT